MHVWILFSLLFNYEFRPADMKSYLFYLPFLYHYFPNDNGNSITTQDIIENLVVEHVTRDDFIGYNVLDTATNSLKLKNLYLNQCNK